MHSIKKFIIRWLKKRGYRLFKSQASNGNEINPLYYLAGFYKNEGHKGSLIQIGANDGVTSDPVIRIIQDFKIPSLLIEPQPEMFKRLKATYANIPYVKFENCAVDKVDGVKDFFYVQPDVKGYPAWATGIASFDKNTLLKHRRVLPDLANNLKKTEVPTFTFDNLLKKHGIEKVLLLQIDAEGYDYELLKSINLSGTIPKLIHYEHKHLSFTDQNACRKMLSEKGYAFLSDIENTIAMHEDFSLNRYQKG